MTDPAPLPSVSEADSPSIGFLGPEGTFTEQALLTQADLAEGELRAYGSISEVIGATVSGEVDLGFVPIENAIEGSVNVTIDSLAFEADLLIQREVVMAISLNLLGPPGSSLDGIERVLSMPMATGQCRRFLDERLPGRIGGGVRRLDL
ncbi:MAG: prephenate dehydratase domain-containing protein, partial [Actinomycetota bacterium]